MTPDELKARQKRLGLSDKALAEAVQVDPRTVRYWKDGARNVTPSAAMLLRIWAHPRCPDFLKPWQNPDLLAGLKRKARLDPVPGGVRGDGEPY